MLLDLGQDIVQLLVFYWCQFGLCVRVCVCSSPFCEIGTTSIGITHILIEQEHVSSLLSLGLKVLIVQA